MTELKEFKYIECFKSICDGSCNYCKSRLWRTGNKVYAMKKKNGKWFACTDKKCYLEQGGKLTIFKRDEPEPVKVKSDHDHKGVCPLCNGVSQVIVNNLVKQLEAYGYQVSLKRWDA